MCATVKLPHQHWIYLVSHVNDVQLVELKQKYNYLKNVKSEEHSVTEIRRFCNFTYSYFQNNASSFSWEKKLLTISGDNENSKSFLSR